MSTIYDEALLDAKKIRDTAELAARNKIMESITPQIREMINKRILFEQDMDPEDLFAPAEEDDGLDLDAIVDSMPDVDLDAEDDAVEKAASKVQSTATVSVFATGDVNIDVENDETEAQDLDDEIMTDRAISEAFANLVKRDFVAEESLQKRIFALQERVQKLSKVLNIVRESRLTREQQHRMELSFMSCIKEAVELGTVIKRSGRGSQHLEEKLNSTIKEMREMSSKYKKNIFDFLFEAEDAESKKEGMYEQDEMEAEEAEVDVEEEDVGGAEDVDVEAASTALEDLGVALGLDLEIADEAAEEGLEGEEEGLEGEEEELDLGEGSFYEIDESVLRRELSKMRRARHLREQEEAVETYEDHPAQDLGDVIEVDEEELINVLADELGDVPEPSVTAESRRRSRQSRHSRARRTTNKTTSRAIREAAQYKKAAGQLKRQLVEMNLFNAKLLYANKLLQNKNLTVKQQRAIVEALDNAKTLREAKLLYKSLSGSLARRGRHGKNLSENVRRTLGSSSRSTRSGSPANNGVETDRWAVLAGISSN